MPRLMDQSQKRLTCKAVWQAGVSHRLFVISLLLAWAATEFMHKTRSLENWSHASMGDHSLRTGAARSTDTLPLVQIKEPQDVRADVFAISHKTSRNDSTLPTTVLAEELTCLALNIYWEARNQSLAGQLAVAQVTMNRVSDPRYADNVCDVVFEHKQFSWYWDGKSDIPRESRAWEKAKLIASAALHGSRHITLQGVTHYHAVYSKPFWKDYMVQIAMIGDHVFYATWQ